MTRTGYSITTKWALGMAAALALAVSSLALAQDDVMKSNIPFAFQVGAKTMPPGAYEIRIDWATESVNIRGPKGADAIVFVTTMAPAQHSTATDAHLVFDKVGTAYTLSEVWQPGYDGVMVYATKGKHQHEVVHVKK